MPWNKTGSVRGPAGQPFPNSVLGSMNGVPTQFTLWVGSEVEYNTIANKDNKTLYVII